MKLLFLVLLLSLARGEFVNAQTVTYFCGFCHKGPYSSYEAARAHTCATHSWGCAYSAPQGPPPPSAEELRRMRESKDLKEAAQDANDKGAECYKKRDWACAIRYFKEALDYDPDDADATYNLEKAQQAARKEEEDRVRTMIVTKPMEVKHEESSVSQVLFETVRKDSAHYKSQLQRLMNDVSKIKVPAPAVPKHIHEGVILGLFNTNDSNAIKRKGAVSPFTGKAYKANEFFATSDNLTAKELLRGVVDNSYVGEFTLNTEYGRKLIEKLQDTKFDRLIAHSNGATVTEALIRKGVIKVDELNIVGGDRALINYFGLNELITSGKVKRVVVWINPGDLIPYGTSAGLFSPLHGARDQYIKTATDYFKAKLTGTGKGGDTGVEYRFLAGENYGGQTFSFGKDIFNSHGLEVYTNNMSKYLVNHSKPAKK